MSQGNPALRRLVGLTLAAAFCLSGASAFASGLAQLRSFVGEVKSAKGEFTQRELKGARSDAQAGSVGGVSSGTFAFARPGKFIWLYQKPYEQLLQADGTTLYVYDKDLKQVTERALGNALGASPAAILFGSNDLDKNFTLKEGSAKDGLEWVELVPKSSDTQFKQVLIGFKDGNLQAMELADVFGNVSRLTFSNIVRNPSLPANQFKFTPPAGVDVISG